MQIAIITKNGTLISPELVGKTFEEIPPDVLMYGCGFNEQRIAEDSQYYIDQHKKYADTGTPEENVQQVYTRLKTFLSATAESSEQLEREILGLNHYWPEMQQILRKQAGLTEIFLDYGCESRIVYPYVARGANAMTLAIAFGKAFDIAGDFRWVSLDEKASFHIVWEAICVGVRRRGSVEVDHALAMDARLGRPWELALLGAGVMSPWHLQKGVPFEKLAKTCHIHGVDMDPRCIKDGWLQLIYDKDDVHIIDDTHVEIPRYNTSFSVENIMEFCSKEANQKRFMGVHMMGVLSYYRRKPEVALALLTGAERVTNDEGYILVDLQLKTTQSVRNSLTFWLSDTLNQDESLATAYGFMRELCDKLGLVCSIVGYDNELEEPSTIIFRLTKRVPRIFLP